MFYFYKKKFRFSLAPRRKVIIGYRRTVFERGFKTDIICDPELAGESKRIVDLLSESARERHSKAPFALSSQVRRELKDYEIKICGIETDLPGLFPKRCEEAGIRMNGGIYELLDEIVEKEPETSSSSSNLENSVLNRSISEIMFGKQKLTVGLYHHQMNISEMLENLQESKKPGMPIYTPTRIDFNEILENIKKAEQKSEED